MSLEDRSFGGPTAVGRYWIAHSEGFAVESPAGRSLGVVEQVAVDPQTSETMLVLERTALLGRQQGVVPGRRVASVMPWSRRLVLARKQPPGGKTVKAPRAQRLRAAGEKARPHASTALGAAAVGARRAGVTGGQLLRLAAAVAIAVGLAAARALKAYAVWLALVAPPAARAVRDSLARRRYAWPSRQWLSEHAKAASLTVSRRWRAASLLFARNARRARPSQKTSGRTPGPFATRR